MRLLWRDRWLEAPVFVRPPAARLLEVEASIPLATVEGASGRTIRRPGLKVMRFLLSDGPGATLRKVRAKREEPAYLGGYSLVAVLGRSATSGERCLALAPRSAPSAEWLVTHDDLCRTIRDSDGDGSLARFAAALSAEIVELEPLSRQSYLHSTEGPPARLIELLDAAVDAATGRQQVAGGEPEPQRPQRHGAGSRIVRVRDPRRRGRGAPVALLGAGDYARTEVVPALRRAGLALEVLCDREPQIAALGAVDTGFRFAATDPHEAIARLDRRGLVVVATYHDSHAPLAAAALDAGHRVLLEKPAVVTPADLDLLLAAAQRTPGELEVGFNRRYNPLVRRAREALAAEPGPATIVCSIREVEINPDHWYLWANQGTRVAGNLCHWIDLTVHLLGSGPRPRSVSVSPQVVRGRAGLDAERAFSISFDDGSTATLVATGRGDDVRGVQEQVEARRGPLTVQLDDLWRFRSTREGRVRRGRTLWRDKGHQRMYREMLDRFARGEPSTYSLDELAAVCATQLAATEAVRSEPSRLDVELPELRSITG